MLTLKKKKKEEKTQNPHLDLRPRVQQLAAKEGTEKPGSTGEEDSRGSPVLVRARGVDDKVVGKYGLLGRVDMLRGIAATEMGGSDGNRFNTQ
jgi:hypothetical protein